MARHIVSSKLTSNSIMTQGVLRTLQGQKAHMQMMCLCQATTYNYINIFGIFRIQVKSQALSKWWDEVMHRSCSISHRIYLWTLLPNSSVEEWVFWWCGFQKITDRALNGTDMHERMYKLIHVSIDHCMALDNDWLRLSYRARIQLSFDTRCLDSQMWCHAHASSMTH